MVVTQRDGYAYITWSDSSATTVSSTTSSVTSTTTGSWTYTDALSWERVYRNCWPIRSKTEKIDLFKDFEW